jgi:hypothetical protein
MVQESAGGAPAAHLTATEHLTVVTRDVDLPEQAKRDRAACMKTIEDAMKNRVRTHGPIRIPRNACYYLQKRSPERLLIL